MAAIAKTHKISGSVDPADMRARFRTPVEVRWHNMAKFDHDFVGREALATEDHEAEANHGHPALEPR